MVTRHYIALWQKLAVPRYSLPVPHLVQSRLLISSHSPPPSLPGLRNHAMRLALFVVVPLASLASLVLLFFVQHVDPGIITPSDVKGEETAVVMWEFSEMNAPRKEERSALCCSPSSFSSCAARQPRHSPAQ